MAIKQIRTFALLLTLIAGSHAIAQQQSAASGPSEKMRQTRVLLDFGREDIIREEMRFSEQESAAFWPVYDRYQAELSPVRDRYADVLTVYLEAYRAGTVSEAMASNIVDDFLKIQTDVLAVKRKFLKDFRKALPARKAARFYQLESKMDAELESQLSMIVPLIDPV